MPRITSSQPTAVPRRRRATALHPKWKLEDAKARFSEIVRLARSEGPQRVTVRGKDAVVVISVEALERLMPPIKPRQNLVAFLQGLHLGSLDTTRERDTGRDVSL
jgi:prevent-host-death family protein